MGIEKNSSSRLAGLNALLGEWPGLVARPDPALVEDSLVLLPHLESARTLIDVGSGGGLPGLALKIVRPDVELALVEANRRKAAFLVHAAARLGLSGVRVVAERAETAGHDPSLRERFDAATARAVAPLPVLAELCLPFVRVGGRLLAMKAAVETELEAALPALELLGGRLVGIAAAPSVARERGQVVVVEKIGPTPAAYPRRPGVPSRRPLGK
jgi:16S rRNA (guanine527-N7)-methyltransferase